MTESETKKEVTTFTAKPELTNEELELAVKENPGLATVILHNCSEITDDGLAALTKLKELKSLDVSSCKQLTDRGLCILGGCKKIETIDISDLMVTNAGLGSFCKEVPGLITFCANRCNELTYRGIENLVNECKGLENVRLTDCRYGETEWVCLVSRCPKLTSLEYTSNRYKYRISNVGLHKLARCRQLNHLSIEGCGNVSVDGFTNLLFDVQNGQTIHRFEQLHTLDVSYTHAISDDILCEIAKYPKLATLDISYCGKITDKGLAILQTSKTLQVVYVTYSHVLTKNCVLEMSARNGWEIVVCDMGFSIPYIGPDVIVGETVKILMNRKE